MKPFFCALALVVLLSPLRAEDALRNGDFSHGMVNWSGDGRAPQHDSAEADPFAPQSSAPAAAQKGVFIALRSSAWSKIQQEFRPHFTDGLLTVVYNMGDASFSTRPDDFINVPAKNGINTVLPFNFEPGQFSVMFFDSAKRSMFYYHIKPEPVSNGPATFSDQLKDMVSGEEKTLLIAFPPGHGTVNLISVTLVAK